MSDYIFFKKDVIIPYSKYRKLMELLEDIDDFEDMKEVESEEAVPWERVKEELQRQGDARPRV